MSLFVRQVAFTPAPARLVADGILGFASTTVAGWRIYGVAVRRTPEGQIYFRYPKRTGRSGRHYPVVHPTDAATRAAFEGEVLNIVRAQGRLAP